MKSLVQVLLLFALCSAGYGVPEDVAYTPEIVPERVVGRITQTTVALEQPLCVFNRTETTCVNCEVWLVVANTTGVSGFDAIKNGLVTPGQWTYLNAFTGQNGFYLTVRTQRSAYPCPTAVASGQIFALRVGSEVPCITPNCNAPLPSGGTFRVKYILINPAVTIANVVGETRWSGDIKLLSAVAPNDIDTRPGRRTGGMVVITTILAILLFLLLALFAAMLAMVCCKKSGVSDFPEPVTTFGSLRKYHTHSLQKQQDVIAPKGKM
ncbi:uroplakin-3b [Heterodontus francisci]|uniref:uroplakin-3b n=1 Tax=Heterodontus francisci TaxID=7792 RepID=UPI00355BC591